MPSYLFSWSFKNSPDSFIINTIHKYKILSMNMAEHRVTDAQSTKNGNHPYTKPSSHPFQVEDKTGVA